MQDFARGMGRITAGDETTHSRTHPAMISLSIASIDCIFTFFATASVLFMFLSILEDEVSTEIHVPESIRESAKQVVLDMKKQQEEEESGLHQRITALEATIQKLIERLDNR